MPPKPKIYQSLLDLAVPDKQELTRAFFEKKLNKKPIRDKYMVYENGFCWQVDIQYLRPNRSVYQYLLVCVDVSTRRCDAEPMRDRTTNDVLNALRKILNRNIIQQGFPALIVTDSGAEFQVEFTRYCNQHGIKHRKTQPGRKNQTAIVENVNGLISYALNTNAYRQMTTPVTEDSKEILNINILANDILPKVIQKINEFVGTKYPRPAKEWFDFADDIEPTDIQVGDKVFVINPQTRRLRFRYGTHKYIGEPFRVTRIYPPILKKQPYRFLTTYSPIMTFTRDEMIRERDYKNDSHQLQFD